MKKIKQAIILAMTMSTLAVSSISGFAYSKTPKDISTVPKATIEEDNSYIPYADVIGWRFKKIDGVSYKRQYNYTKQKWLGEWEKV